MRLNNVNRRRCCIVRRLILPSSAQEHFCKASARAAGNTIFSTPASVKSQPLCGVFCVPGLSRCSESFVCLMTSLRGLLALDGRSQNDELSYSHVFKGAASRYMIGNFCHDSLIINIKIDTKDAVQKCMHLPAD